MIRATTRTIASLPYLETLLADCPRSIAGWGRKPSGQRAIRLARLLRRPVALLEDGFIRSVERSAQTLSLLVDDLGVYYDASAPSRMEKTIATGADEAQADRARALASAWRTSGISKYNHAPDYDGPLPEHYVLVTDQTFGDLAVIHGSASEASFATMLAAAIAENPDALILVKIHPDVLSGKKRGYFPAHALTHHRVRIISSDCHPCRLLRHAAAVYVVTSLMGFEALLLGRPVRCFGMPFYAGWGITQDELPPPARRRAARIEDVTHAALVALPRYVDPRDGTPWRAEQAIAYVAARRRALFEPSPDQGPPA